MLCQPVTVSGYAEWPKVADAVIKAPQLSSRGRRLGGICHELDLTGDSHVALEAPKKGLEALKQGGGMCIGKVGAVPCMLGVALPLHSRVETGNPVRAVQEGIGGIHLPHELWLRPCQHFNDARIPIVNRTGITFHVAIGKDSDTSSPR